MTDAPSAKSTLYLGWESADIPRLVLHDPRAGMLPTLQTRIVASRDLSWLKGQIWLTGRMSEDQQPRLETTPGKALDLFPVSDCPDPGLLEAFDAVGLQGWREAIDTLLPQLPRLLGTPESNAPQLTVTQDGRGAPIQVHLTGRGLPARRRPRPKATRRNLVWI